MFENRSQQSKTEVKARIERSQNSSHEQTCFLLKKRVEYQYSSSSRKNHDVPNNSRYRFAAIKKDSAPLQLKPFELLKKQQLQSKESNKTNIDHQYWPSILTILDGYQSTNNNFRWLSKHK